MLWAYRNSTCNARSLAPYRLTCDHDAVLPLEIIVRSLRLAMQNELEPNEYHRALFMEMESADEDRLMALENIQLNKLKVAQAYNKQVKKKRI